jgi:hypothetical protein
VKRPDPHTGGRTTKEALDAIAHLAGGLIGERDGENRVRVDAMHLDEARDAHRKDTRLARTGAGENEERTIPMEHGFTLCRIQPTEE